jgi:hypothetical protein
MLQRRGTKEGVTMNRIRLATAVAITLGFAAASAPASAGTGCNGVVNQLVWGCAFWDNNNGPNFPYYRNPKTNTINIPKTKETQIRVIDGQQQVQHNGRWMGVVSTDGASLIATDGSSLRRGN